MNLIEISKELKNHWEENNCFEQSINSRDENKPYVFYEGPPSANGKPGIHHVMARTIKDIFCRYKTLQGFQVKRKAGWDTHGLPVEISVEKTLGITKEDIGKKISVEEYNQQCRKEVMKYKDMWDNLTKEMGYWVDLDDPYITFDNKYIESVWYILKKFYEKDLLYKGYTIQPYSPAAGTGLSTHELNQPGCYKDVKDTSCTASFKIVKEEKSAWLFDGEEEVYFLAWTTTPWTLPSNTALAIGEKIDYVKVKSFNPYTGKAISVFLAKERLSAYFDPQSTELSMEEYKPGDKKIPYRLVSEHKGRDFEGIKYEQLIPWIKPLGKAFEVIIGDYVTTEDGTGIVHIAPTFGADDNRVAKQYGIVPLLLIDKEGNKQAMVDRRGRFYLLEELDKDFIAENVLEAYKEYAGRFVKNEFSDELSTAETNLDIDIAVMLKQQNKAFKVEKYVHNYPHCWRTDKPILYYPLDSWFVKTTAIKDRMISLNKTINWKPQSTGSGRFANWLENLVDWNLSRSRFWGIPLPIWTTEDKKEQKCIGSAEELKAEIEKSVSKGFMDKNPLEKFVPGDMSEENYASFDFHRPYCDNIVLVSESGQKMFREKDLIDVWFDSGSMPYAQFHYPFENKEVFEKNFPADFIAEGVDQTRGWFFTLHAIATMMFDSVAFKNVISNGLVLDKNGNKMSKRLGNAIDPFETINNYGADTTRWYMITNSQPWDNLKFDLNGLDEVRRKFFGTLYNTYSFFALYANIDGFAYKEADIPQEKRPEIDRWILSELHSLIQLVEEAYEQYEPTKAGRAIQAFVDEHLSNWYVRLCRRRFWKGDYSQDKISAYQTLYTCLEVLAHLISPIAPFFADRLFIDLNSVSAKNKNDSVHLSSFPKVNAEWIDKDLEERMQLAQKISSMTLSLRKKTKIRVRQPLQKIMIAVMGEKMQAQIENMKDIILSEVNVKEIEYVDESSGILVKKAKPNFKTLGPKFGKQMKEIAAKVNTMTQEDITAFEKEKEIKIQLQDEEILLGEQDIELITEDIPGWVVSNMGNLTVALDISLNKSLVNEGIARELVNRIQNIRKEKEFDVTDSISIQLLEHQEIIDAIKENKDYICAETLAKELEFLPSNTDKQNGIQINLTEAIETIIFIEKF
ncbi:MAG TPA: isoleucine--tRNA ligase [Bacteroidetes bacterium]|nr:isoleucine--tRNA ligase [Bacteroidota bacterium]